MDDAGRPGPADRHRRIFRHLLQCRRRLHGHDRPGLDQSGDREALRPRSADRHHRRHGARPGHADRPSRHRDSVLRRRRLDGRHAGSAMGGELIPSGSSPRCRSPPPRGIPRRTSPFTRSAGRRSWRTPTGAAGAISNRACARRRASRSRAWRPTSPICRKRRCSANSAASCRTAPRPTFSFDADFQIENYLRHQGSSFVDRFDANSYLYVTRACDYFDLARIMAARWRGPSKARRRDFAWSPSPRTGSIPTSESRAIVHALNAGGASVSFVEIETDKGHDAFLLDVPEFIATTRGFLARRRPGPGPASGPRLE